MIVASPWSRGGRVNSQLFDHTSTLLFLEHFVEHKLHKAVKENNISAWRQAIAGDLTSVFRPYDPKEGGLEFLDRDQFVVSIQRARNKEVPSNYRKLTTEQIADINNDLHASTFTSHQEPGIRPSCGIPYELYADGGLSADGSKFALTMKAGNSAHGKRSMGAPFNVYVRNGRTMRAATYTVRAGDALHEEFPLSVFADGRYQIDVHGPNGFYRSFTGTNTPGVKVSAAYEFTGSSLTGNVLLNLSVNSENKDAKPVTVTVIDNSYGAATVAKTVAAGQKKSMTLDYRKATVGMTLR